MTIMHDVGNQMQIKLTNKAKNNFLTSQNFKKNHQHFSWILLFPQIKTSSSHFSHHPITSIFFVKKRMCYVENKTKKRKVEKPKHCSGNSVKTPTNFAAACCELKIFYLVLRDFSSLEIMAQTPVVVLDRGNNTTCTINLHGCTIVSWRVNNQVRIYLKRI